MTPDEITKFDGIESELQTVERNIRMKEHATPNSSTAVSTNSEMKNFRHFLKTMERRDVDGNSNNSGAEGKFTNPDAFSNELFHELTSDSGILSLLRTMSVSSDYLDYPTVDDTTTGATGKDVKQDPELKSIYANKLTFKNVKIKLNTYAEKVVLANQVRDDNQVNLESMVAELGAEAIARNASVDAFTILNAGITISDSVASGVIDYTDLVTLLGSVNGRYYAKGSFLMSQAHFIGLLALIDSNKQPIVKMPIEEGMKPSLFGKGITIDDNAGENIYFGDFSTVILAQNQNTTTLVDIYSESDDLATKYVTSARMGAGVLSAKAVHGLKAKA